MTPIFMLRDLASAGGFAAFCQPDPLHSMYPDSHSSGCDSSQEVMI